MKVKDENRNQNYVNVDLSNKKRITLIYKRIAENKAIK